MLASRAAPQGFSVATCIALVQMCVQCHLFYVCFQVSSALLLHYFLDASICLAIDLAKVRWLIFSIDAFFTSYRDVSHVLFACEVKKKLGVVSLQGTCSDIKQTFATS